MFQFDWLRYITITIVGCAIVFAVGFRGSDKTLANDLALALQKAHLGKLPKGQYDGQYVYTKNLSREELCIPLDGETLRRMAACTEISKHEMSCRVVNSKVRFRGGTITLAVSIHFIGQMADGQQVSAHVNNALVMATIKNDKVHGWTLNSLRKIS